MKRFRRLLIISGDNYYARQVMTGIHDFCAQGSWEYHAEMDNGEVSMERCRLAISSWKADGIIAQVRGRKMLRLIEKSGLPTINFSSVMETSLPSVLSDNVMIGKIAAAHLLNSGSRNFGFCALTSECFSRHRLDGFSGELARAGIPCEVFTDHYPGTDEVNWVNNRRRMDKWLRSLKKPVAILCIHDIRGQEASLACRRLGLRIPDDVALVGVDNDEIRCQMCVPPLSSVDIDAHRIGYEAAKVLDKLLSGRSLLAQSIRIPPRRVIARKSSDVIAVADPEVASAVRFIHDHAQEPINVNDVLQEVPLSRRTLERRFEFALGRTPKAEIMRLRILRAKELLVETTLSVSNISQHSGFTGPDKFCAVFRRETGQTPLQFRRGVRTGDGKP